jgi:protein-L-isoaspartate(D-aspartate) O-methyltransferase
MTSPVPSDFRAARRAMIDSQLRPEGVNDPLVLAAMAQVPREDHVPAGARAVAYADRSIPLDDGRALMPPAALGKLLQALAPAAGEKALIAAPAGTYAAALLAALGVEVDVEPGATGPYDFILVDGAVDTVPRELVAMLAEGGRLAAGLNERGVTRLVLGRKSGGAFGVRSIGDASLPLVPGAERPAAFAF